MQDPIEGGCLCSAVRYRISGLPIVASLCHCRSCRLAAGATRVAWVVFRRRDVRFTRGHAVEFRSSLPVTRTFCAACGTALTYRNDDSPETIDITTATLDQPDRFPPVRELWLEHKISWEPENPALVHYPHDSAQPHDRN